MVLLRQYPGRLLVYFKIAHWAIHSQVGRNNPRRILLHPQRPSNISRYTQLSTSWPRVFVQSPNKLSADKSGNYAILLKPKFNTLQNYIQLDLYIHTSISTRVRVVVAAKGNKKNIVLAAAMMVPATSAFGPVPVSEVSVREEPCSTSQSRWKHK